MNQTISNMVKYGLSLLLICIWMPQHATAVATGNISTTSKYAWSENTGWQNYRPADGGVTVNATYLSGFVWAENIGFIELGKSGTTGPYLNTTAANWGVNRDVNGILSGFAWSENAGWINFNTTHSQVTVDTGAGFFDGYAWGENVGWIHFKNPAPAYNVVTTFIPNSAPTANAVTIAGTAQVGNTLTGSYTYADADGDLEGVSTFRWLRGGTAIAGATATTYTLLAADIGTTITFEVTPVAATGTSPGTAVVSSGTVINSPPTASSVTIAGTATVDNVLTGSYAYTDVDADLEGTSTFRWLRGGAAITGATATTYTLLAADSGTTITFEVTPVAATGAVTGTAVASAGTVILNSIPTASSVTVSGTATVDNVLTGSYTYADADGDLEGVSTFRWLRGGTAISGATATTYKSLAADIGSTITFEVTPVAATGTSPGTAVVSAGTVINSPPPIAVGETVISRAMSVTTGNVLVNDTGSGLRITAFDAASVNGGTVVSNGNGVFTYTRPTNFIGNDSFTYTVKDSLGRSSIGTVTVVVNGPPSAIWVNKYFFRPGDTLALSASITPGTLAGRVVDTYITIRMPTGQTFYLIADGTASSTPVPFLSNWSVASGTGVLFNYVFQGTEPVGGYAINGFFTAPGTMTSAGVMAGGNFYFSP